MLGPMKYPIMSPYFGIRLTEERRTLEPVSPLKNGTVPTTGSLGSPVVNFIKFFVHILHTNKAKFQAEKRRSYEKFARKMLMKLTPGGNRKL
jgi:hypothetical protein